MAVEIDNDLSQLDHEQILLVLLNEVAHEAAHNSVDRVEKGPRVDDFGVLGRCVRQDEVRGFYAINDTCDGPVDLIHRVIIDNNISQSVVFSEEFDAELSRARFTGMVSKIVGKNLDYGSPYGYDQGIVNAMDNKRADGSGSWHDFFDGIMDPSVIASFHEKNDRWGFFKAVGDVVVAKNPTGQSLSDVNRAAVGLVVWTDFADYRISQNQILNAMMRGELTPEFILLNAQGLKAGMNAIDHQQNYVPVPGGRQRVLIPGTRFSLN